MAFIADIVGWLNAASNLAGRACLSVLGALPGWLSLILLSVVTALLLLMVFKFVSNQAAIARTRNDIKANLLAMRLFKDNIGVACLSEWRIILGALRLIFHSLRPMAVMILPLSLLLAQMGLWYQTRPLEPGQEAVVTVKLAGSLSQPWPSVHMTPGQAAEVSLGPIRVFSKNEICWQIKALEPGYHNMVFTVNDMKVTKELAIGPGFMRVSPVRPERYWLRMLQFPAETALAPDSVIQSIRIDYPEHEAKYTGTNAWMITFFILSTLFAFIAGPFLKVKL